MQHKVKNAARLEAAKSGYGERWPGDLLGGGAVGMKEAPVWHKTTV